MIVIDGKNTWGDLRRLAQRLVVYTLLFVLGALFSYYRQSQADINRKINVICEPLVRFYQLPPEIVKTGAE